MTTVLRLDLINEADRFLDTDLQYRQAVDLGKRLYDAFPPDQERISTQIRNLEQMVISATRLCDIEDFVKTQMGREGQVADKWREVGDTVLEALQKLRNKANEIGPDESARFLLRLHLARGWIRAVVGGYLYEKASKELEARRARR